MSTEQLNYDVIEELGDGVELRQYQDSTFISAKANDSNSGFRILSGYIFGNNKDGTKIPMTAPVLSQQERDMLHMSFVLPSDYDSNNAPVPVDERISIHEVASRKLLVVTFSGFVTNSKIESRTRTLEEKIQKNNITKKGNFFLMRYDAPWVLPMFRRNELAVEVE
ncbi:MAG: heme-binding protein [Methanolobus sp.]|nr:heme-binding protein [Methanolobus sp.]